MSSPSPTAAPRTLEFEGEDVSAFERWLAKRPPGAQPEFVRIDSPRSLHAKWLDTARSNLLRAGLALVVRGRGRRCAAVLRSLDSAEPRVGPFVEGLRDDTPAAVRAARGPVGSRVLLLAGRAALRELAAWVEIESTWSVRFGEEPAGTLAIHDYSGPIEGERRRFRIRRVHLTVPARLDPAPARVLTEELSVAFGLRPTQRSVLEAVLAARGIEMPRPPELGPTAISSASTLGEAAFATLRREFAVFLGREQGTRLGDDPEDLHEMRVASRRLRAAIRLFRDALPHAVIALREDLSDVAAALGEVRDLDVQNERLAAWAAQDRRLAAAALAPAHRDDARRRMLALLDSPRYRTFRREFAAALRAGPARNSRAAATAVVSAAPDLVRRRRRKVKRAARHLSEDSPPAAFHALRILCKRLRYALEFLEPVYGEPAARLAERFADVQALLGRHQDARVAIALLEGVLDRAEQLPAATAFAMGVAVERSRQEAARLRERFPRVYERTTGKPWQRLVRTMDELARDSRPAAPRRAPRAALRRSGK